MTSTDHSTEGEATKNQPTPSTKPATTKRKRVPPKKIMTMKEWVALHMKSAPERSDEFVRKLARIHGLDLPDD